MLDCNCPESASLIEIIAEACGVDFKQIQKLAFQRRQESPSFTAVTVLTLAAWQAFTTAEDETKIVITPFINRDPIIEAGEAITTGGGDNSTLNGIEELEGVNPSRFSGMFTSLSNTVEKQIKALTCEKNLTVYFFLQGGRIAAAEITGTPNEYQGIEAFSVFMSDRNNAGFATKDTHSLTFSMLAGWSEDVKVIKPNFNPLTEL